MRDYIKNSSLHAKRRSREHLIYNSIPIFIKDHLPDDFDIDVVIQKIERTIPETFFYGVDGIYVGQFDELNLRGVNAMYKDGAIYTTNIQSNEPDMVDDVLHEVAHALEERFFDDIYADQEIKNEFLGKRRRLYHILKANNYSPPHELTVSSDYSTALDDFLYKEVGYPTLTNLTSGLFLSPYAVTSLREYFAIGFETYYLTNEKKHLKITSPSLYNKLRELSNYTGEGYE